MIDPKKHLYLASRSARRRELLRQLGVSFEVLLADSDESPRTGESVAEHVVRVSLAKLHAAENQIADRKLPRYPVLSGDTVIGLDGDILGKPRDTADAARILAKLSGRTHEVFTAMSLSFTGEIETVTTRTEVTFATLSPEDIERYVASGEPMDKAGAYAIQGRAAVFIPSINGSYSGVIGLPLHETLMLLKRFGIRTD